MPSSLSLHFISALEGPSMLRDKPKNLKNRHHKYKILTFSRVLSEKLK